MPKPAEKIKRTPRIHIYKVEVNGEFKLVRTTSRAKAVNNYRQEIKAVIPTADELVALVKEGVNVDEIV